MFSEKTIVSIKLLEKLKTSTEWSLQQLASSIGVSIDELNSVLRELGKYYLIETIGNRVYWNKADNPSMIKPWGWSIIHEIILGSTQEYVRNCSLWTVVVAEQQLYGRGRHGKKWFSNFGGLWCSFRLSISSRNINYLPLAIPLIVVRILNKYYSVDAMIKWPNDIVYRDRKIAGLVIEAEAFYDSFIVNIGLGINVNNYPPIPGSISLRNITGYKIPRNNLLMQLIGWISRLEKILSEPEDLVNKYLNRLSTLNRKVQVKTTTGVCTGQVTGVNEYGELIVKINSEEKIFSANDVLELRHID